tara:strand:+ start:196 stop:540 length:345 start_codon:yes stop_codon:yes gene_type:complete
MRNDKIFNTMLEQTGRPLEYTGTLPLTLEEFPYQSDIIEKGRDSNIVTKYDTIEMDGVQKLLLYPTMRKGKLMSQEEIDKMLANKEHFGIYDNLEQLEWADQDIHEKFKYMYGE